MNSFVAYFNLNLIQIFFFFWFVSLFGSNRAVCNSNIYYIVDVVNFVFLFCLMLEWIRKFGHTSWMEQNVNK